VATLTGKQIRESYDSLLKLEDNDGLTTNLKTVTDGLGTATPLAISQTEVNISVDVQATGFSIAGGTSNEYLMADGSVNSNGGDLTYTHNQSSASNSWSITHNLGKFPSISVVDSGLNVVQGEVIYTDNNSLTINFTASFSGKAYLN